MSATSRPRTCARSARRGDADERLPCAVQRRCDAPGQDRRCRRLRRCAAVERDAGDASAGPEENARPPHGVRRSRPAARRRPRGAERRAGAPRRGGDRQDRPPRPRRRDRVPLSHRSRCRRGVRDGAGVRRRPSALWQMLHRLDHLPGPRAERAAASTSPHTAGIPLSSAARWVRTSPARSYEVPARAAICMSMNDSTRCMYSCRSMLKVAMCACPPVT